MSDEKNLELVESHSDTAGLSFKGLAAVFYEPGAFFKSLSESPRILVAYLLYATLIFGAFWFLRDILIDEILRDPKLAEEIEAGFQGQAMTSQMKSIIGITQVLSMMVAYWLEPLVASVLILFWGNFVFGGTGRYRQILAVVVYASLIFAVGRLVVLPMCLMKESMLISFSLGSFVPGKSLTNILYLFLSKFDLFTIWQVVVVGIGLSTIYKFPRNKGYLISVLSLGLMSMVGVLIAAIRNMVS